MAESAAKPSLQGSSEWQRGEETKPQVTNNRRNNKKKQQQQQRSTFQGREPNLKGHIYDLVNDPDTFIKTTKEITILVGRTYTEYTAELSEAIKTLQLSMPTPPNDPDPTNMLEMEMWKLSIKEHIHKTKVFTDFKAGLYNIVLGQCTEALEDKLRSPPDFPAAAHDGLLLLRIIKAITYTFEERRKLIDSLLEVKERFYRFRQGEHMSLQRYYEFFEVLDTVGVNIIDMAAVRMIVRDHSLLVNEGLF